MNRRGFLGSILALGAAPAIGYAGLRHPDSTAFLQACMDQSIVPPRARYFTSAPISLRGNCCVFDFGGSEIVYSGRYAISLQCTNSLITNAKVTPRAAHDTPHIARERFILSGPQAAMCIEQIT